MPISNRPRCRSHALKNAYTTRRRGAGRGLGQPMPNWMMVLPRVTSGGVTSEVELVVDACMMPETDDIRFFRPSDRYGFLSNFYYSDFTVDGNTIGAPNIISKAKSSLTMKTSPSWLGSPRHLTKL